MSLQRIPYDSTKYKNNPVELVNISDRCRIGVTIDSYTKLLLHMDGANDSTTFIDECGKTVTSYGGAKIRTTQSKFNGSSGYFDGSDDYLLTPVSSDFDFGTGDFTIEFFVYAISCPVYFPVIDLRTTASFQNYISGIFNVSGSLKPDFVVSSGRLTAATALQLNTWYHIAFIRTSGVIKCSINGNFDATTYPYASTLGYSSSTALLFRNVDGHYANGYIDELRVSKGIARWTSNFTPPTLPHGTYNNYIGA